MSILVLTSDTLIGTPASGNLEYNGQFYGTDSNASRAQLQRIVRATAVTSTSGTAIDFANIPAWVERITVIFQNVSLSATANILVQLGTGSTTYTTTGYTSISVACQSGGNSVNSSTAGFVIRGSNAANQLSGRIELELMDAATNLWACSGVVGYDTFTITISGSKSLSATLDRVRLTTAGGTDTFDGGSVNVNYII